jgi:Tubulin-tyrosine ligase family
MSDKHRRQLIKLSELEPPYWSYGQDGQRKPPRSTWEAPSLYLLYKVMKYHKLLKETFPQYVNDGTRNIWIVKPSYNARGFGIYLIDSMKEIMQSGRKSQQKIVQKYIERPYLLKIKQRD